MDPEDDKIDALTSSDSAPDEKQAAAPAAAESSPAQGETPRTVLDVVRDVRKGSDPDSPAPVAEKSAAEQQPEGEPEAEGDEEEAAEQAEPALPYYKDPRFQRVLRQRKAAREKAAAYEQDATRYRNVQQFLDNNGVGAEDAAAALEIAALLKRDRVKAWERLEPLVRSLLEDNGRILPDDLQQRVIKGEITIDAAQELSQARARAKLVEQQRMSDVQIAEQRSMRETAQACRGAAEAWASEREQRDPHFKAKVPALQREIVWLQREEGVPDTPDGVKAQLAKAYRRVNETFAAPAAPAAAPAPKPAVKPAVQPTRSSGVSTTNASPPKPKSVLDIVRGARA